MTGAKSGLRYKFGRSLGRSTTAPQKLIGQQIFPDQKAPIGLVENAYEFSTGKSGFHQVDAILQNYFNQKITKYSPLYSSLYLSLEKKSQQFPFPVSVSVSSTYLYQLSLAATLNVHHLPHFLVRPGITGVRVPRCRYLRNIVSRSVSYLQTTLSLNEH